jgi:hypothetical protein
MFRENVGYFGKSSQISSRCDILLTLSSYLLNILQREGSDLTQRAHALESKLTQVEKSASTQ